MEDNIAKVLNNLIKTSRDGEEGFRTAAENVTNQELKTILLDRAEGCNHAVLELQKYVTNYTDANEVEEGGTILGAIHRGWLNLKSMITGDNDQAILAECERGESVAKEQYAMALEQDLPENIHTLVKHQYDGVLKNYDLVRSLSAKFGSN
ncbi:MAG: PA2169 family four-helix-bundle protein [Janthinobacterium lividum]